MPGTEVTFSMPVALSDGEPLGGPLQAFADRLEGYLERSIGCRLDRIDTRLTRFDAFAAQASVTVEGRQVENSLHKSAEEVKSAPAQPEVPAAPEQAQASGSRDSGNPACWPPRLTLPEEQEVVMNGEPSSPGVASELSVMSGEVFKLKTAWHDVHEGFDAAMAKAATYKEHTRMAGNLEVEEYRASTVTAVTGRRWWIIPPSSRERLAWDLSSMFLMAYDMVTIPLNLAFEPDQDDFLLAMFWVCLVFWTMDLCLSFVTGYYLKGAEVVEPCKIVVYYLRTWFLLDVLIIAADWFGIILGARQNGLAMARMGKTLRVLRIVRTLRLLRLMKLRRIMEDIQDRVTSEYFHIVVSVVKLLCIIVCINHCVACFWWGVSKMASSAEPAWHREPDMVQRELAYQYFTSLHWSLTQFTPASMEIVPMNLPERAFSVLVLLFALIVFSSFVSSITAAMTNLRQLSSQYAKSFSMLRRYLRDRSTPQDLTLRIIRYAEHRVNTRKQGVPETDVKLLQILSNPLKMELVMHNYGPLLAGHAFFARYSEMDTTAMRDVCFAAIKCTSLAVGDTLFTEATSSDRMFFVIKGCLRYVLQSPEEAESMVSANLMTRSFSRPLSPARAPPRPRRSSHPGDFSMCFIREGEWCSEASLWTRWAHFGTARAMTMCEVVGVDAAAFAQITRSHRKVAACAARYAQLFVEDLNYRYDADLEVSDLPSHDGNVLELNACRAFSRRDQLIGLNPLSQGSPRRAPSGILQVGPSQDEQSDDQSDDSQKSGESAKPRMARMTSITTLESRVIVSEPEQNGLGASEDYVQSAFSSQKQALAL